MYLLQLGSLLDASEFHVKELQELLLPWHIVLLVLHGEKLAQRKLKRVQAPMDGASFSSSVRSSLSWNAQVRLPEGGMHTRGLRMDK